MSNFMHKKMGTPRFPHGPPGWGEVCNKDLLLVMISSSCCWLVVLVALLLVLLFVLVGLGGVLPMWSGLLVDGGEGGPRRKGERGEIGERREISERKENDYGFSTATPPPKNNED